MRKSNERFIHDLKEGCLSFFLEQVKKNRQKLCLEVRKGKEYYINIYYRGGRLLKITQKNAGYCFCFNTKYCLHKSDESKYNLLNSLNQNCIQNYIENFETMMLEMDSWLKEHPKAEREFQHKLLACNPQIIDIEYEPSKIKKTGLKLHMRLDMLMVNKDKLIIVENKFGIRSIAGDASIRKHYEDICQLLNTADVYDELIQSVENISKAKYELGLLENPIETIDKSKTEILFLLADFNDNSKLLERELSQINITYPINVLKMSSENPILDLRNVQKI